jgi:hypothetical protein
MINLSEKVIVMKYSLILLVVIIVSAIIGMIISIIKNKNNNKMEKYENIIGNINNIANAQELSPRKTLEKPFLVMPKTVPASFEQGYVDDSIDNNYTADGYKWTVKGQSTYTDEDDAKLTDIEIRDKYKNMYMLDPTGELEKYNLSNNPTSRYCCPAAYRSAGGGDDGFDAKLALEYSNKYVANNYSGMNFDNNAGCLCVTPEQAKFFATRGGNTTL